jgi:predicted dehydrogenase
MRQPNVEQLANMKRLAEAYPNAARYSDYREMLDKQENVDGVVVATPDHVHAIIAMAAIDLGKHVSTTTA